MSPSPLGTAADHLSLDDDALFAECSFETTRGSGPGGQHRNKTESGVRLRHRPTGVVAQAFERRSQHENRAVALRRLREAIALEVRRPVEMEKYAPTPALRALLSGARQVRIGPNNPRYWHGVQHLLDLFVTLDCSVADTAAAVGLSTGALSRTLLRSPEVMERVNRLRAERSLPPLKR